MATDNTRNIDDAQAGDPKVVPSDADTAASAKPAKPSARKTPVKPAPAKAEAAADKPKKATSVRATKPAASKAAAASAKPAKPSARKTPAKPTAAKAEPAATEPKKAASARVAKPKAELADEVAASKPEPKAVAPKAKAAASKAKTATPKAKTATPKAKTATPKAKTATPKPKAAVRKPKPEVKTGEPGKATVVDQAGKQVGTIDLDPSKFAVPANINTLHLVVRASQAARRRGTASTKTRGEISGSTAKLYRQKGTGRARVGSVKSPTRVGGGVAFGPHPRSYDIKINRKVVRKALLMALSDRASNGSLFVARDLQLDKPSTARVNEFLVGLEIAVPVLVVAHDEPEVTLSTRNLVYAEVAEATTLTTEQVLRARSLVLTEKAFTALSQA